jgi:hypothetical protein
MKAMSYMHSMPKLVHVGWTESKRSAVDAKQPRNQIRHPRAVPTNTVFVR